MLCFKNLRHVKKGEPEEHVPIFPSAGTSEVLSEYSHGDRRAIS